MKKNQKIINFTPTGTQTRRENSHTPLLPSEIIEEIHEAQEFQFHITIKFQKIKRILEKNNLYDKQKKNTIERIRT